MLSPKTLRFLSDLKKNNDREWFQSNKDRYLEAKADFESLVADLIDKVGAFDPDIKGSDPAKCVFRIFRDTRFSKDKSPYKTNMAAHVGIKGNKFQLAAGYYIHLEPGGGSMLGGGAHMPPPEWLKAIRQAIDRDGGELQRIVASAAFKKNFGALEGEQLQRVPQGFRPDHLYADLLRRKSFLAMHKVADKEILAPGFAKSAAAVFKAMQPFNRFLNEALEPD
jgi:uncharacterized protein (TIGR02453 family)